MAAGTFTKLAATPYTLKYTYTGAGSPDSLSAAQLLADCAAGPLKSFLSKLNLTNPISGWNFTNVLFAQTIRVYATQQTGGANFAGAAFQTGGTNTFAAASTGACTTEIEITFKHSTER